jgi:hypothetical protein
MCGGKNGETFFPAPSKMSRKPPGRTLKALADHMKRLRLEVPYPKQQTPHNVLEDLLKFQGIDKTNLSMSTICDKIATAVKEQLAVTKSTGDRGQVLREDSSDVLVGKVLVGAFAEPCTHLCASMRDDLLNEKPLTAQFLELTKYLNDDRNDVEQMYDFQSVATYAIKECDILPLLLQIVETRVRSKLFLDAHAAVDLISSICDSLPRLTVPILLENGAIEVLCSKLKRLLMPPSGCRSRFGLYQPSAPRLRARTLLA